MKKEKKAYMFSLECGYIDVVIKNIDEDESIIIVSINDLDANYYIYDEMNYVYEAGLGSDSYDNMFPEYVFISEDIDWLRNELDKLVNPQNYK